MLEDLVFVDLETVADHEVEDVVDHRAGRIVDRRRLELEHVLAFAAGQRHRRIRNDHEGVVAGAADDRLEAGDLVGADLDPVAVFSLRSM